MEQILVVDDQPHVVDLVTQLLKREGYVVKEAFDGQTAVGLIESECPDLVVLDWMLPEMDGLEVCRWIRAHQASRVRVLPVLMLTARSAPEDVGLALRCGVDDYLPKPFRFQDLLVRVRSLLGRQMLQRVMREGSVAEKVLDEAPSPLPIRSPCGVDQAYLCDLVVHELGNVAQTISGYTEYLVEQQQVVAEPVRFHLGKLLAAVGDLAERLGDLRLMIRLERQPASGGATDLAALLTALVQKHACELRERSIQPVLHLEEHLPPAGIPAAAANVIFRNLLSNAMKYNRKGGKVLLEARRVGDRLAVRVADTGIGIRQGEREGLFQRGMRGEGARDRAIPGMGLGLYLVGQICARCGGDVAVDSEEGKGTAVTILLPMARHADRKAASPCLGKVGEGA